MQKIGQNDTKQTFVQLQPLICKTSIVFSESEIFDILNRNERKTKLKEITFNTGRSKKKIAYYIMVIIGTGISFLLPNFLFEIRRIGCIEILMNGNRPKMNENKIATTETMERNAKYVATE